MKMEFLHIKKITWMLLNILIKILFTLKYENRVKKNICTYALKKY